MNPKTLIALAVAGVVVWLVAMPASLPERPTQILDAETLVETISDGEEVDLQRHLQAGAWTLVEFNAPW